MFSTRELWLGDETSLREAAELAARALDIPPPEIANANLKAGMSGNSNTNRGEQMPRMYSRNGRVGVITIRGGLMNAENWMTRYFEAASYPAIREALVFAAKDNQVDKLLLDIESPGGAVSGCNDTAKLLKTVNGIKPITAFSDGVLASAAYWLASGASKIYVGETAIVGSIGVVATIVSEHESLKKEGIDVRVIRAGKNKALDHPAEPIKDKAVKQLTERADAIYTVFHGTCTKNRPQLKTKDLDDWAEGNTFLGAEAVSFKLADGVSSFDQVFAQLTESVDKAGSQNNNSLTSIRGTEMSKPRAVLDPKVLAIMESGLTEDQAVAALAKLNDAEATEATQAEVDAAAKAKAEADAAASADAGKTEATAEKPADAAATPATDTKPELTAYLETQVKERDAQLLAQAVEIKQLKDKAAETEATLPKLVEIAAQSVNKMQVALGGSATSLEGFTPAQLVEQHAKVSETFKATFKVEGVASTPAEDKNKKSTKTAAVSSLHLARVNAARTTAQGGK